MGTAHYRRRADIPSRLGRQTRLAQGGRGANGSLARGERATRRASEYLLRLVQIRHHRPGETGQKRPRSSPPSATIPRAGKGAWRPFIVSADSIGTSNWKRHPPPGSMTSGCAGTSTREAALVNVSIRREGDKVLASPTLGILIRTLDGQPAGSLRQPVTLDAGGNADLVCPVPLTRFGLGRRKRRTCTWPRSRSFPARRRSTGGSSDSGSASWKCAATVST